MSSNKVQFSQFELLLFKNPNHLGTSILLLLAWIAASDGNIDKLELKELEEIAKSTGHVDEIESIISIAEKADLIALQLASEIIKVNFSEEKANLFMQMSIGMAVADGYLLNSENYILRFIADLLNISSNSLNNIFFEMTGRYFPNPDDLSESTYWQSSYSYEKNTDNRNNDKEEFDQKRIKALAILGLDEFATIEEIKASFKRLAKIHHPDRFVSLGEEAVQAATQTFKRILSAYKYLTEYA